MRSLEFPLGRRAALSALVVAVVLVSTLTSAPVVGAGQSAEPVDLDAIFKIKEEGFQRSEVMEVMSWLTDVYGPRLTGSPGLKNAADWAVDWLQEHGITDVTLEPWGPFGRGWTNDKFAAYVLEPTPYPIIGYPKAWTPGTDGLVRGEAVIAIIDDEDDFETWAGKLESKFVLTSTMPAVAALFEAPARRFTDDELEARAAQPMPTARGGRRGRGGFRGGANFSARRNEFFIREGIAGLLDPGRGSGGTVFVGSGGSRNTDAPEVPTQVVLAIEHYGRIYRTLEKGIPVVVEMEVDNQFYDDNLDSFNVIAEIPGTDLADEIVMLGAHFDSWHSGTGATDNAAGSAVMMEAMRILETSGLPMRRTVRMGLWSGEEQGLLGSRAYVTAHFTDRSTMSLTPDHEKFSAYYNVDNGTGAIRGVYLQGNEAIAPVFEAWMKPFENLGMTTLTIRNTGGTDHQSFDRVGLPGFQFIQDPVEYNTRTHHSSMDVYERVQAEDMMKNAVIVASFVYHSANRDELLPRKPLPAPQGGGRRGGR
ncbi:MAG: M20/M25/M40 family metallo-hydrolase [Acidobacteria bacterium]|nr:M20/M25/M40 family metallo-hydrolase [Acidobacteriota bacterium]